MVVYLFYPGVKVTLISVDDTKKTMFCNIVYAFFVAAKSRVPEGIRRGETLKVRNRTPVRAACRTSLC